MKHLTRIFVISMLLVAGFTFTSVRPAHADCTILDASGMGPFTVSVIVGHTYRFTESIIGSSPPIGFSGPEIFSFSPITLDGSPGIRITIVDPSCTPPGGNPPAGYFGPLFYDGRLNDKDGAQTAAVYCMPNGDVSVYALGNPWFLSFTASPKEIANVPKHPTVNTLIKQGTGAALYRLTDGQLQLNAPGQDPNHGYYFIFPDCPAPLTPQQAKCAQLKSPQAQQLCNQAH